jgi:hypothetical protein
LLTKIDVIYGFVGIEILIAAAVDEECMILHCVHPICVECTCVNSVAATVSIFELNSVRMSKPGAMGMRSHNLATTG